MVDNIGILSVYYNTMPCRAFRGFLSGFYVGWYLYPPGLFIQLYSLIIHCFKGKHGVYTVKKLEYTEKRVESVWIYCIVWICYEIVNIDMGLSI